LNFSPIMREKQENYLILLIIFILSLFFFILPKKIKEKPIHQVCSPSYCWEVELALTAEEKEKGLMFRETLPKNKGMLFVFKKEDYHPFWMKNVLIPLDIIWLDKNKKIVFISSNVPPCHPSNNSCPIITPPKRAKYVLEINGGLAKSLDLKTGDILKFKYQIK